MSIGAWGQLREYQMHCVRHSDGNSSAAAVSAANIHPRLVTSVVVQQHWWDLPGFRLGTQTAGSHVGAMYWCVICIYVCEQGLGILQVRCAQTAGGEQPQGSAVAQTRRGRLVQVLCGDSCTDTGYLLSSVTSCLIASSFSAAEQQRYCIACKV